MKDVLHFIKQLQSFAGRILYLNILGMVVISLLEGIGIFLLIPLISMSGIFNVPIGIPMTGIFEFLDDYHKILSLPMILVVYVLLVIAQSLLQRNLAIRDVKIHSGFINHLRLDTYRILLQANWDFFICKRKSDLINSMTTELGRVGGGLHLFLQFVSSIIYTLIQVGFALWLSVKMTIFVLFFGLFLAFFSRTFIKKSTVLGKQTSELAQDYLAGMTEHFNGIKDIKSNMLEESRYKWLVQWCEKMGNERVGHFKLKMDSQVFYKVSSAIIIAILIFLSVRLFHAQFEQLLLVTLIFFRLWPRFSGIQSNLEQIASCISAFHNLIELQREGREAKELTSGTLNNSQIKPMKMSQGIECRQVYFRYNTKDPVYALQDLNLFLPFNHLTAIAGRSGAGKSTFIDILMGLLKPEKGQVLIDGIPLMDDNLLSFRRSISYVPQDPFLFNGSIRENLMMIEPSVTEEEIWESLDFAASAEFVRRLPKGLDTLIGDRGVRLSGGERQRLVLARAILRKPSILVLDEATSALDSENESKIQEALDRLKGKMTIVVIAHRLSTIRNADQVIVLDQGRLVQIGGFNQLATEKRGVFSRLLGNQMDVSVVNE